MSRPSVSAWRLRWARFLLASGAKGKRYALPNSEILIHQPLISGGGLSGQTTDIKIHSDHLVYVRSKLSRLLSEYTGQPLETIERDTERDNYMTANRPRRMVSSTRSSQNTDHGGTPCQVRTERNAN